MVRRLFERASCKLVLSWRRPSPPKDAYPNITEQEATTCGGLSRGERRGGAARVSDADDEASPSSWRHDRLAADPPPVRDHLTRPARRLRRMMAWGTSVPSSPALLCSRGGPLRPRRSAPVTGHREIRRDIRQRM